MRKEGGEVPHNVQANMNKFEQRPLSRSNRTHEEIGINRNHNTNHLNININNQSENESNAEKYEEKINKVLVKHRHKKRITINDPKEVS